MPSAALCQAALALLSYGCGGVAPIEPPTDPCLKAILHAAPATEGEWRVVTFDIEDLRIRRRGQDGWIRVRETKWRTDALWAVSPPRWTSARLIPGDSLTIPWSEIDRIEKPIGRQAGEGAVVGALVGLGVGLGIAFLVEGDCSGSPFCGFAYLIVPIISVPAGAIAGALTGSTVYRWAPFFCAPSPTVRGSKPLDRAFERSSHPDTR